MSKLAKRKTLPKDFDELLKNGDIEALKAVFTKCEINAVTDKYGFNAFGQGPLPRAFAFWLKEQGGNVNQPNYYGETPIFGHASAYYGDVALLLELGAGMSKNRSFSIIVWLVYIAPLLL